MSAPHDASMIGDVSAAVPDALAVGMAVPLASAAVTPPVERITVIEDADGLASTLAAASPASARAPTSAALALRALVVRRTPGIGDAYALRDLSTGVNVIVGPNGIGKSSTARAIEALLWDGVADDALDVEGEATLQGAPLRVAVTRARRRAERDGVPCPPPLGAAPELRARYHLALHELLAADRGGRAFADEVRRQSQGGYDVAAAAFALGFAAKPSARGAATKALELARAEVRRTQDTAQALAARAATLEARRAQRDAAAEAAARVARLDAAIRHAEAATALAEADATCATFPHVLASLRGDEPEVLARTRAAIATAEREALGEASRAEAAAREAHAAFGDRRPPDDATLAACDAAVARLDEAERTLVEASRAQVAAAAREEQARTALGPDARPERLAALEALGADGTARLAAHAAAGERLHVDAVALAAARRALDAEPAAAMARADRPAAHDVSPSPEVLREGVALLTRWLAEGRPDPGLTNGGSPRTPLVAALAAVAVIGCALLAWRAPGVPFLAVAAALALLAIGLAVGALRPAAPSVATDDPRPQRARDYAALAMPGDAWRPAAWTPDGVRPVLEQLLRALADAERARAESERLTALAAEWRGRDARWRAEEDALETRRAAHAAEHARLVAAFGLAPSAASDDAARAAGARALAWLGEALVRWREARGDAAVAAAERARVAAAREAAASRVAEALAACGAGRAAASAEDVAGARAADTPEAIHQAAMRLDARTARELVTVVRAACARHAAATARTADARQAAEAARGRADMARVEAAALLARAGLDPEAADADGVLGARCAQLPAWRAARQAHAAAAAEHEAARRACLALPGADATLLARDAVGLREDRARAAEAAATYTTLVEEITRLQQDVERAAAAHDVEGALVEEQRAADALRAQRDADLARVVGHVLAARVSRAARDAHLPDVFHRAREHFLAITRGRWRLAFADREGSGVEAFRAVDEETGAGHALDELSGGTRVQLLLAVRLAFVETLEGDGPRLPLLLDETLATSDDARAGAIVDAVVALARDGRQVFYFTAQRDEVRRWEAALAASGVAHATHDLAAARRVALEPLPPFPAVAAPDDGAIPAPRPGEPHDAYGARLGHGPLDPRTRDAHGAPLWYVVDDCDALHAWARTGVGTWGALRRLVQEGGALALLQGHERAYARAAACARALDAYLREAAVGRGRPVTRAILADTDELTDTMLDRVATLLPTVDGCARRLLAALEDGAVPRFGRGKCDALRAALQESGHLDESPPRTPEALRIAALAAVGDALAADVLTAADGDALLRRVAEGPRSG